MKNKHSKAGAFTVPQNWGQRGGHQPPSDPTQATHIQVTHTVANLYGWVPFQINTEIGSRVAWDFYQ